MNAAHYYLGRLTLLGPRVVVDGHRPLCPRWDLAAHARRFSWGRHTGATTQLALALLADHCGSNEQRALTLHEAFGARVLERLAPDQAWLFTTAEIDQVLTEIEREQEMP